MPLNGTQTLIESHEDRIATLERSHNALLPAMAKLSTQVGALADSVDRVDSKMDAITLKLQDAALKTHDLERESAERKSVSKGAALAFWTLVAAVGADVVLHVLRVIHAL